MRFAVFQSLQEEVGWSGKSGSRLVCRLGHKGNCG